MSQDPARVFVSCGQRDCCEKEVANRVKDVLEKLGYEPYLAVDEQSLRSLRENIFERLRDRAEYFLFVDFCREKIGDGPDCRGSMFSHQELAIASFLDFGDDFLAFQEQGVLKRDGMIGAFQGNVTGFQDRSKLPEMIKGRVEGKWQNNWRRKLVFADDPDCEAVPQRSGTTGFFFHVRVMNRHRRATARNCYALLRSIGGSAASQPTPFESAEVRWAGYPLPNAIISPGRCFRRFDAVWFDSADPLSPRFNIFSDWPRNQPALRGPRKWTLEYEVISENVPGSTISLALDVGNDGTVRFGQSASPVRIAQLNGSGIDDFNRAQAAGVRDLESRTDSTASRSCPPGDEES